METLLQFSVRCGLLLAVIGISKSPLVRAQHPTGQPVCVEQVADFVYQVRVSNPAQVPARLQLVDASGTVLYQKTSAAPAFGEKLNLRSLGDGRYAVVVKLGTETRRFALDLHTTQSRSARLISLSTPAR